MVKQGNIYRPTDKRRTNRRIRVVRRSFDYRETGDGWVQACRVAEVESRLVGQRKWFPAPAIRLDRLESRHYKLVRQ